jgi:hypothetical protein
MNLINLKTRIQFFSYDLDIEGRQFGEDEGRIETA